jgi:hypothetical protein
MHELEHSAHTGFEGQAYHLLSVLKVDVSHMQATALLPGH